jgi:hypothetical protein
MNKLFSIFTLVLLISATCYALEMADSGWAKQGFDLEGRCVSHQGEYNPCMPNVEQIWQYDGYTAVGLWGSPVIVEGKIYLPTDEADYFLACHDLNSGNRIWGAPLLDWANGTPVVADDGSIFISDYTGFVYRITSGGNIDWQTKLPNRMAMNGVVLYSNRVYCIYGNPREEPTEIGGLACLDAESGTNIWTFSYKRLYSWASAAPPLSPDRSLIYVHSVRTEILGFGTMTGTLDFRYYKPGGQEGNAELQPLVDKAGNIYCGFAGNPYGVGTGQTDLDTIVKVTPDNTLAWANGFQDIDIPESWANNVWDSGGYALSEDDTVIFTATTGDQAGGGVRAYDTTTGQLKWQDWEDPVETNSWIQGKFSGVANIPAGIAVGANRMIYGVSSGGYAFGIRDLGGTFSPVWVLKHTEGEGAGYSFPAIAEDGTVVMCSDDGVMAAYRLTSPLNDSTPPQVTLQTPADGVMITVTVSEATYTTSDSGDGLYGSFLQVSTDSTFTQKDTVITNWLLPEWNTPNTVVVTNTLKLKDMEDNFWRVITHDNVQNVVTSETWMIRVNIPEPATGMMLPVILLAAAAAFKR